MNAAAGPPVVAAKLRAPALPVGVVTRTRLLARLAASRCRVVLVAGPAGFGKSVLVTDWLQRERPPSAWLSLDELDNDPRRLLNHLAGAFDALGSPAGDVLRAQRDPLALAREPALLEALATCDPSAAVVLDDVHLLEEEPSLEVLRSLVELRGTAPRFVLLTRVNPPFSFGRLRAAGELLELREQDLRFTLDEAEALFAALLPDGLDADLVRRLDARTEGWAAGLRMAAIALERASDRGAAVDAFTGSHQFVADYLIEEAISRQPPDVQRFLMETSILSRFTAATCAAVMADAAAPSLLDSAEAAHLFLVPLGEEREWFRYHHLFAELLQYRLRRLHPERLDVLHERASTWFEQHGDVALAIEHAARMNEGTRAAMLLDGHALAVLARSEMVTLKRWLRLVPEPYRQPWPTLLLSVGWIRALGERTPELEALFDAARLAVDAGPPGYDDGRREATRAEIETLRAYHARFCGRFEEALQTGARLLQTVPQDATALRGRVLFNQGRAHMMVGEMAEAAALLQRSIDCNLRAGTHYLVLTGLAQQAAVLLETDGVPRARHVLEAAVRLAEDQRLTRLPAFSIVLFHLGHVLVIADELDDALPLLQSARALGAAGDMPDGRANAIVAMARVHAARGEFDAAEALLLEAETLARTANLGLLDGDIDVPRRRHALYAADAGLAALPLANRPGRDDGSGWTLLDEAHDVCDLLEALRRPGDAAREAAAAAIERIVRECEWRGRHQAACIAHVAAALLHDDAARWQRLDEALTNAAARQYVRPLLEIGPALRPLLQGALSRRLSAAARGHARLLLDRMGAPAGASAALPAAAAPLDVSALTDREREVLLHLARGMSNKAIARSMFVSPETVKTHVRHVFDKLGVSRRRDAAKRARELGLADIDA